GRHLPVEGLHRRDEEDLAAGPLGEVEGAGALPAARAAGEEGQPARHGPSTALEKSMPRFGPSARYSPGGRRGGGEAPPGGSAKRRTSGAERQGGDLLTPWKYSARQKISSTYSRRAVLSTALEKSMP